MTGALLSCLLAVAAVSPIKTGLFVGNGPMGHSAAEWIRLTHVMPELDVVLMDAKAVKSGALDKVELFIMPGGSSIRAKKDFGDDGINRIKGFLRRGGGYIGTCAGLSLLMDDKTDPERGIGIIPYRRAYVRRRMEQLLITVNARGAAGLGISPGEHEVWYHDGPVIAPSDAKCPDVKLEVLATFGGESDPGMDTNMVGQIATIGGTYGKGRICATACHPEYFPFSYDQVNGMFRYVTGRSVSFPQRHRKTGAVTAGIYYHSAAGVDSAKVLLALDDDPNVDVIVLDELAVSRGMLDHIDVLILPNGDPENMERYFVPMTRKFMADFVARGGKAIAWSAGAMCLPKGGTVCRDAEEVLKGKWK